MRTIKVLHEGARYGGCLLGTIINQGWAGVARVAARKLDTLASAHELKDLRSPPGNKLEALKGDLAGHRSTRINDQWRVVFRWTENGPADVDILAERAEGG